MEAGCGLGLWIKDWRRDLLDVCPVGEDGGREKPWAETLLTVDTVDTARGTLYVWVLRAEVWRLTWRCAGQGGRLADGVWWIGYNRVQPNKLRPGSGLFTGE